jgi:hypothetical protein
MPVIHPETMKTSERLPGWHGRSWRSENMSFVQNHPHRCRLR